MNIPVQADAAWERVGPSLRRLSEYAVEKRPDIQARIHRSQNEFFPLRATLGLGHPRADFEDLVVSINIHTRNDKHTCTADLLRGDGLELAQGPTTELTNSDNPAKIDELLNAWIRDLGEFLETQGRKAIDTYVVASLSPE